MRRQTTRHTISITYPQNESTHPHYENQNGNQGTIKDKKIANNSTRGEREEKLRTSEDAITENWNNQSNDHAKKNNQEKDTLKKTEGKYHPSRNH